MPQILQDPIRIFIVIVIAISLGIAATSTKRKSSTIRMYWSKQKRFAELREGDMYVRSHPTRLDSLEFWGMYCI